MCKESLRKHGETGAGSERARTAAQEGAQRGAIQASQGVLGLKSGTVRGRVASAGKEGYWVG